MQSATMNDQQGYVQMQPNIEPPTVQVPQSMSHSRPPTHSHSHTHSRTHLSLITPIFTHTHHSHTDTHKCSLAHHTRTSFIHTLIVSLPHSGESSVHCKSHN